MAPQGLDWGDIMLGIVAGTGATADWGRVGQRTALLLLSGALCSCAWLDEWQRELALRPTPTRPGQLEGAAASFQPTDQRFVQTAPGTAQDVAMWWLPQADPQAPALLYLHGTFRNLYGNLPKINALREAGYAVLAVDYRGWGDSAPIVPSEASIYADAQLAWAEFQRRAPDASRRVIFGHSMGGAVAVALASGLKSVQHGGTDYAAVVLESTFNRMPDVAATAGFWGRVAASATTLDFDSQSRIGRITAPITMLHGTADKTVPVELGRKLRGAAPAGTRWVEFAGGTHSRLHEEAPALYQETLRSILQPRLQPALQATPEDGHKTRPASPARSTSP
jgi:pimeloyl-ACP methyl ester carboxylesterase